MKKLLLIFLLAPFFASGQCITKKDEITGKATTRGMVRLVPGSLDPRMPIVYLAKQDTSLSIGLIYGASQTKEEFDLSKMMLLVKFEGGNIKRFKAGPQSTVSGAPGQLMVGFNAPISSSDLPYFRNFKVTFIRLSFKGDESFGYDPPIKPRLARQLQEDVACIQ